MKLTAFLAAAGMAFAIPAQAQTTTTLLNSTNLGAQVTNSYSLSFTALTDLTSLSFAGYNVPGTTELADITVQQSGGYTNLLPGTFTFTPAATGSSASQANGNLFFSDRSRDYDTFTTSFASVAGSSYLLTLVLQNTSGAPVNDNGIRITEAAVSLAAPVPEPVTWGMMTIGLGAIGFTLRRRKAAARIAYTG